MLRQACPRDHLSPGLIRHLHRRDLPGGGGPGRASRSISLVDDVTWLAEGDNISEVVHRLERCAAASLRWAGDNAVRFETQALAGERRETDQSGRAGRALRQGVYPVARSVARLGSYPPGNRQRRLDKARQAEARL